MKIKQIILSSLSAIVMLTGISSIAQAKGFSTEEITVDGVKFMGTSASAFIFQKGNDNHFSISDLFGETNPYQQILKFDNAGIDTYYSSDDYSLSIDATSWNDEDKTGQWGIDLQDLGKLDDSGLPATIDLVVVLKAANAFTAYKFDDLTLAQGSGWLDWQIQHKKGSNIPALSHLSIYAGDYTFTGDTSGDSTPSEAPEPATMALLGLGLLGVASVSRKSRKGE